MTPRGYLLGNVVLLSLVELGTLVALVVMVITQEVFRPLLVVGAALVVDAINFPTGRIMDPAKPS